MKHSFTLGGLVGFALTFVSALMAGSDADTALRDAVFDIVSHGGTGSTPAYSLWMLIEVLEGLSWLKPYVHPLLPLAESHQEVTGADS